jgi:hypothetical protein
MSKLREALRTKAIDGVGARLWEGEDASRPNRMGIAPTKRRGVS